jgi:hexosaminidase
MSIKTAIFSAAVSLMAFAAASPVAFADVNAKPFTVPELRQWKGAEGSFIPTAATTRIVYTASKNADVAGIASQLQKDYAALTGITLPTAQGKAQKGDITLKIAGNKKANSESYTLSVTADGVTITAPTSAGLIWGTRTLLQITEQNEDHALPLGTASDYPEFALRGFMLDAGRKYIPMDYMYALVDAMAYYKMNVLHVHLNDNGFKYFFDDDWDKTQAAFRMESDRYPGLTARDGSYTKSEFRDFVKYAATKGVEIIPEIDFPAHALAFTRYMPEIGSTADMYGEDHLNLMEPKTYEFLDNLLDEYMEGSDPVFAGPRVHIGTDEYSNRDSVVVEKFRYLTDRYIRYVEDHGKQACVWGSLTHAKGKQPVKVKDVLMYGWSNGYADPREMIKLGYKMVSIPDGYVYIVPNAGYYYDYLNTEMLYDEWTPANIGGTVFTGDTIRQIEGGMFAVWNDHPNNGITVKDIHHRVMAALPTMAAKTWDGSDVTVPYSEFISKSSALSEAPGVNYLGRYGTEPGQVILSKDVVAAGSTLDIPEIGYDYTVEFDIEGASEPEAKGTVLFESPNATLWLSDPVSGNMAFSREEHLYTFRQNLLPGEKLHVKITGTNKTTTLWVNGKLVDDMNVRWVSYNGGRNKMAEVRTLVFPLQKAGNFNATVTNLKVINSVE